MTITLAEQFSEKLPTQIPIVVIDTETTGLHPGLGHRIVEIGAVRLENWQITGQFDQQLFPERHMDSAATKINGITDDDLIGMPLFADILPELLTLMEGALLVAHNAHFDATFLAMEMFISGYQSSHPTLLLPNPWLCTLQLARRLFYFDSNSLGSLARHFRVRTGTTHRAIHDVYTTVEVLKRMLAELSRQNLRTVGDLLHAQGPPIYAPPPPAPLYVPEPIAQAVNNGQSLRLVYMSAKNRQTERIVTPKYISQHVGVDYLVAHCHMRDEQRTFRLDRIIEAAILND